MTAPTAKPICKSINVYMNVFTRLWNMCPAIPDVITGWSNAVMVLLSCSRFDLLLLVAFCTGGGGYQYLVVCLMYILILSGACSDVIIGLISPAHAITPVNDLCQLPVLSISIRQRCQHILHLPFSRKSLQPSSALPSPVYRGIT